MSLEGSGGDTVIMHLQNRPLSREEAIYRALRRGAS